MVNPDLVLSSSPTLLPPVGLARRGLVRQAAAPLAHCLGRTRLRHNVKLPEGRVEMTATAARAAGGWRVEQAWGGISLQTTPAVIGGRDAVVCTGTFNDYLVVRLRDRAELE